MLTAESDGNPTTSSWHEKGYREVLHIRWIYTADGSLAKEDQKCCWRI